MRGLAIIPLVKGVPQATSQEDSWPELSFDGPQVPAEFDRDIDDANVTNDAGSLAGFGRSSSRGSPRNIFFNPEAGYIGKIHFFLVRERTTDDGKISKYYFSCGTQR